MPNESSIDLLRPLEVRQLRLALTTRCNLRCVYCAVSQLDYQGEDMPIELAQDTIKLVIDLARTEKPQIVHVNGHGETTFRPGWIDLCKQLLDEDLALGLTTNLARAYSPPELDVLGRMNTIFVSIDSADQALLRRMRRKVDVRQIIANIRAIRKAAERQHLPSPIFRFSSGLYDQNTPYIHGLAQLAVDLKIDGVGFWNLTSWNHESFPYFNTDVPETDRAYPLDTLPDEQLRPLIGTIRQAIGFLESNGVSVNVAGDFVDELATRVNRTTMTTIATSDGVAGRTTLDCVDPWIYVEIATNGDVRPCCAHTRIGNLRGSSLDDVLNGAAARQLRQNLLTGNLDQDCRACKLRSTVPLENLQKRLSGLSDERLFVQSERVADLLRKASDALSAGGSDEAWTDAGYALAIDPGLRQITPGAAMIRNNLPAILKEARFPLTLSWLAAISQAVGDLASWCALLEQYLKLAPDAPDRDHVLFHLHQYKVHRRVRSAVASLPGHAWEAWMWLRRRVRLRSRLKGVVSPHG